ncbi:MAG: DUF4340 domain-containing protein [Spirochaetales bacterium]|nr:DUF4340 domain-containing protein [Spirochaetales bacterium]
MKKNMIQLIILGGAIVVLVLFLVFNNINSINYKLPELSKVGKEEITRFTVTGPSGTMELVKDSDNNWKINPQGYPAAKNTIDTMVKEIAELTLTELVASGEEVFPRYNLDDANKVTITAYNGEKEVRKYEVGKSATSQHTFVKLMDDQNVYRAKGDFRYTFDKKIADIRDKTVFNFNKDDINSIETVFEGRTHTVLKYVEKDTSAEPEKDKDGNEIEKTKTVWRDSTTKEEIDPKFANDTLDALYNLNCIDYLENPPQEYFNKEYFRIALKGPKDYTLTVYDKIPEKEDFPTESAGNPYKFTLPAWRINNLTKLVTDMLDKKPASK